MMKSRASRWSLPARQWLAAAVAAMIVVMTASPSADASSPIEGVWSFTGGKVAIQAQADGTLVGTVVAPTKFAQCTHPTGERMWTEMRRQPDGSYAGFHQWFFATDDCIRNPTPGPTAWRVLQAENGERFLRACFSEPGSSSQPTISPSGAAAGATFGCVDSALISSLPNVSAAQFKRYVTMPGNERCIGGRRMRIRVKDPPNDPLKRIVVKLRSGKIQRGAKLRRRARAFVATLDLKGLPPRPFTVTVRLTTVLGERLSGKRTYLRCAPRRSRRDFVPIA